MDDFRRIFATPAGSTPWNGPLHCGPRARCGALSWTPSSVLTPVNPCDPDRDAETARLLNLGEAEGLRRLLQDHAGRVLALLRQDFSGLLDLPQLEDCLSEAVVLAWRRGQCIEFGGGSLAAWLFALARNCARHKARQSLDEILEFVEDVDRILPEQRPPSVEQRVAPERSVIAKETLTAISQVLYLLAPRQQAVLTADLTNGGVAPVDLLADELKTSRNAIYVARAGARRALLDELTRRGHEVTEFRGDSGGRA